MPRVYLQEMVDEAKPFEALPPNWNTFDIGSFSRTKTLWNYQRKAVENAIKTLWKYYEDFQDYQPNENTEADGQRKEKFFQWYRDNGLDEELDIPLANTHKLAGLLSEYYAVEDEKISYDQFINRGCFWMATGSGKTLVLVKLIEVLRGLIQRREIPPHDILILSCRDDLIEQLKKHVHEFNAAHSDLLIHLRELREYAEAKRDNPVLFKERELTVFYYRSDNLSDEQKEKIIDFRNYDDEGKWYVLLDEAHKGDREESKRQHIYSILSRNGFLFNFSATFTDARDLATTVSNFNLSEFIKAGYGKHIAILQQELRAFRDDQDYNNEEKQKIVLKSLLMLAYARKFYERVRKAGKDLYHKPLLLTLVNSVNTEEADLHCFSASWSGLAKGKSTRAFGRQRRKSCARIRVTRIRVKSWPLLLAAGVGGRGWVLDLVCPLSPDPSRLLNYANPQISHPHLNVAAIRARLERLDGISGNSILQLRDRVWLLRPNLGTPGILARSRFSQEVTTPCFFDSSLFPSLRSNSLSDTFTFS